MVAADQKPVPTNPTDVAASSACAILARLSNRRARITPHESACGKWRLPVIGADDERLGNKSDRWESHVSEPSGGSRATKHGHESLKIAGHSPFDEPIRRRYFSLLDCAARTQSGAKQSGRLGAS